MNDATRQLALDFQKATAITHSGERGSLREDSVRQFLSDRLPGGFAVKTGFAFDARDKQSRQLDVLIYGTRNTPFLVAGEPALVPCESLLAAIEIKSVLDSDEVRDSLIVAESIRSLKPFDKHFVDARDRGASASDDLPRCFFSIFSFSTDLVPGNDWLDREGSRFTRIASEEKISTRNVDRLVVMDRGIINCSEGRGHDSVQSGTPAVQLWFVHLINHLLREERRRKLIDINIYMGRDRWSKLRSWEASS
jgi:hypothetical protein